MTVQTVSLAKILRDFAAPRVIHFLSLDVEGAEFMILKEFPFCPPRRFLAQRRRRAASASATAERDSRHACGEDGCRSRSGRDGILAESVYAGDESDAGCTDGCCANGGFVVLVIAVERPNLCTRTLLR